MYQNKKIKDYITSLIIGIIFAVFFYLIDNTSTEALSYNNPITPEKNLLIQKYNNSITSTELYFNKKFVLESTRIEVLKDLIEVTQNFVKKPNSESNLIKIAFLEYKVKHISQEVEKLQYYIDVEKTYQEYLLMKINLYVV
jgi:hypothetical protein